VSVQRIEEENEKKKLEGNSFGGKGGNKVSVQMDADLNTLEKYRDRSTNTREQVARKAGVGIGTVARYNKVMNSNDEDIGCIIYLLDNQHPIRQTQPLSYPKNCCC